MGTTAQKLQAIMNSKIAIRQAISSKGVTITQNTLLSDYASKIGEISTSSAEGFIFNNIPTRATSLTVSSPTLTSGLTNIQYAFQYCSSLTSIPLFDTSSVTSMFRTFYGCTSLTSIPLFDTSHVTNMSYVFYNCSSLTSIPALDFSSATNLSQTFYGCSSLTSIPSSTGSSTSSVSNFSYAFKSSGLTSAYINTDSATNYNEMFSSCSKLESIHITKYYTTGTNSTGWANNCSKLKTITIDRIPENSYAHYLVDNVYFLKTLTILQTNNVKSLDSAFYRCTSLEDLSAINVSSTCSANSAFTQCGNLTNFGGLIGMAKSYSLSVCTLLTHDSLMNCINGLADLTGATSQTLTIGATNLAKLTAEQIAVATAKNWVLA